MADAERVRVHAEHRAGLLRGLAVRDLGRGAVHDHRLHAEPRGGARPGRLRARRVVEEERVGELVREEGRAPVPARSRASSRAASASSASSSGARPVLREQERAAVEGGEGGGVEGGGHGAGIIGPSRAPVSAIVGRMKNRAFPSPCWPRSSPRPPAPRSRRPLEATASRSDYESTGKCEPALALVHCWSCDRHLWDARRAAARREERHVVAARPRRRTERPDATARTGRSPPSARTRGPSSRRCGRAGRARRSLDGRARRARGGPAPARTCRGRCPSTRGERRAGRARARARLAGLMASLSRGDCTGPPPTSSPESTCSRRSRRSRGAGRQLSRRKNRRLRLAGGRGPLPACGDEPTTHGRHSMEVRVPRPPGELRPPPDADRLREPASTSPPTT